MSNHNERQGARLVIADTDAEKSYWHAAIERAYKAPPCGRRLGWWRTRIGALNKVFGGQRRYGGGKLYQFTDDDADAKTYAFCSITMPSQTNSPCSASSRPERLGSMRLSATA